MSKAWNRRKHKRVIFTVTIDYSYPVSNKASHSDKGVTSNLSEGGMGLYTSSPLCSGQDITIRGKNSLTLAPSIVAHVQWCKKVSDSIFKVGLMFDTAWPSHTAAVHGIL